MPWSGSTFTRSNGTYTGATVWAQDAAAGVKIQSGRHDTHDQDLAAGINACLKKDGGNTVTGNINWGGFKITNLAAGSDAADSARFGQTVTAASINPTTNVLTLSRADGNITVDLTPIVVGASYGSLANKGSNETITGNWTFNAGFSTASMAMFAPSNAYRAYFFELTTDKELTIYSEADPMVRAFRLKDGAAWISNKQIWTAGNFDPTTKSDVGHTHAISGLSGVSISGLSDGQVLQYSSGAGAFVNRDLASLSGVVRTVTAMSPVLAGGTATDVVISVPAASASTSGLMSSADKAKLDGLPSDAVASFNGRTGSVVPAANDYKFQQLANVVIGTATPPTTMDEYSIWIYNPTTPTTDRKIYMLWNTGGGKVWLPIANNT